jgi:hypothetical protein
MNTKKIIYSSLLGVIYLLTLVFAINGMLSGGSDDFFFDILLILFSTASILLFGIYLFTKTKFNWLYISSYIPILIIHLVLAVVLYVIAGPTEPIFYTFPISTIILIALLVLSVIEVKKYKNLNA